MKPLQRKVPIRAQMIRRSWFIFLSIFLLGGIILTRIVFLQTKERDNLLKHVKMLKAKERTIYANRGNILSSDGKGLLATTVPKFTVGFDPSRKIAPKDTIVIRRKDLPDSTVIYAEQVKILSGLLAKHFKEKSKEEYYRLIMAARRKNKKYIPLIRRQLNVEEAALLATFPFFNDERRLKGGAVQRNYIREYPFGRTAHRTIGGVLDNKAMKGAYGIEFSFNDQLGGTNGYGFYDQISGGYWRAVEAGNEVQPEAGKDIVTTLDINFQDITETALLKQLAATGGKYGSVIVMEIQTGEIKAIANYGRVYRNGSIQYIDNKNYAVTEGTDPGSTFKLASMLALLEKTGISPDDYAANCQGSVQHSKDFNLRCSHAHGNVTVRQVLEQSCNVGVYQLMKKYFGFKKNSDYFDYIEKFRLADKIGFQLKGEANPVITSPKDKSRYSNLTIPSMSIGYEMQLTPLQTLAFYNAVANNGYWVEPIIVKEIRVDNEPKQVFTARKSSAPICSARNVRLVKQMLEGAVLHGTAKNINEGYCRVAGKTGTAQKLTGGYRRGSEYYTSFAGYFPADNPKYSCIVVIDEPENGSLYGNTMAAPVFREIADKIFAYDVNMHPTKKPQPDTRYLAKKIKSGYSTDLRTLASELKLPQKDISESWVSVKNDGSWQKINAKGERLNVQGMVLRDALHILENAGYSVAYTGRGKVVGYEVSGSNQVSLSLK